MADANDIRKLERENAELRAFMVRLERGGRDRTRRITRAIEMARQMEDKELTGLLGVIRDLDIPPETIPELEWTKRKCIRRTQRPKAGGDT